MSTAVAVRREIVTALEKERPKIEALLPSGVTYERVMSDIFVATRKPGGDKILECEPQSVVLAVAQIQQWGLQIGNTAHLVPYGAQCTAVADYKGLIELVIGSGVARAVLAHAVYEHDEFRMQLGSAPAIEHVPVWKGGPRGALVGAYAVARMRFGEIVLAYMRLDEIEAIRAKSKQWGPQKVRECPEWYAVKTAVRRLCKMLPKNARLAAALAVVEREEADELAELERIPAAEFTIEHDTEHADAAGALGTSADAGLVSGEVEEAAHEDRVISPAPPAPSRALTPEDVPGGGLFDERDLPPKKRRDALREG